MEPAKDLSFLTDDVKRQREIAQNALEEAKRIDGSMQNATDPEMKEHLKAVKEKFLSLARDLATNASTTSSSAINVVGGLNTR